MDSFNEAWNIICEYCKNNTTTFAYDVWIKKIEPVGLDFDKGEVTLLVPNDFHRQTLQKCYIPLLNDAFDSVFGTHFQIVFQVPQEVNNIQEKEQKSTAETGYDFTFDTFIVGSSNKFAHAASIAVAQNPAGAYNPLFLYGHSGLGKTHLLCAISNEIKKNHPETNIVYVKGDDFTNELVEAIRKGSTSGLRNKYRNADVLLVDDIQFIGGKEQTQEEFFHTFTNLYNDSKQIIVSSDRSPNDLKLLAERLRTRFCWGLTVNIGPPDFELRKEILRKKIVAGNFEAEIPEEVIEYIASNMGSDIRQLEGSITRLVAYSTIMGGSKINLSLAIEALKDFINKGMSEKNDIARIQKIVAEFFQISVEDIRSKKRSSNIAFPRQIAMYMCRKLTNESYPKIGTEFGGKDHSTVMHSVEKIEIEIKNNKDLAGIVEKLSNDLK